MWRTAYHTVWLVWQSTKGNVSSIGGLAIDSSPSWSPYCFWGQWLHTIVTWVTLKDRHIPGSSLRLFHSLWASDHFTGFCLNTNIPKKKKKVSRSLELESQTVLSYHVGAGTSEGATSVHNLWTISPAHSCGLWPLFCLWLSCLLTSTHLFNFYKHRYCQPVLCETVQTAKLTPVSDRLQDIEEVGPFVISKEVGNVWYI